MKKLSIIIILTISLANKMYSQEVLYSDKNNVSLKINIVKTNIESVCSNNGKKINIWRVDWTVNNNTPHKLHSNHNAIATGNIQVPMSTVEKTNCTINSFHPKSENTQDFPFIGFTSPRVSNRVMKPYETLTTSWYYYAHTGQKPILTNWNMHPYKFIKKKKDEQKKEDDFWSGKKETSNNHSSSKNDDFWSGGKEKTKNNVKDDFWKGKGNKQEELTFEENTKADDSDKFIGNVRSRTNRIRIFCIDTGAEDGDLVSISNNGNILNSNIYLTNAGRSYWFDLKFGQNRIEIKALNQGTSGANTAAFKVYDDKGIELAQKGWHLKTGYKGTLLILKI